MRNRYSMATRGRVQNCGTRLEILCHPRVGHVDKHSDLPTLSIEIDCRSVGLKALDYNAQGKLVTSPMNASLIRYFASLALIALLSWLVLCTQYLRHLLATSRTIRPIVADLLLYLDSPHLQWMMAIAVGIYFLLFSNWVNFEKTKLR